MRGSCLVVLLMLVRAQEMVSGAAGMDHKGTVWSRPWRNGLQEDKVKRQESEATLLPSRLDQKLHGVTWVSRAVGKQQSLYCRIGIGFHLQILPSGRVNGTHESGPYAVMELFSVKIGIVCIRSVATQLFLAITGQGKLYASETFTEDCLFKEQMEENYYTTYSSHTHPRVFVALTKRGRAKNGSKASPLHPSTHFIPRMIRGS